ncbi:hypothetical protein [Paramicrobacterium fandaimingii]|uniref:hypothetical protein n=1 Tax=Paramicrobacterium fandaimingii TaxID=2708079 RepID=UPI0014204168|nr:hypothetical protein [Microbacterium fandaimingii]
MSTRTEATTPWPKLVVIACALSIVVGVVLLAFSWPAVTASAHDVPVGIVGADDQVDQVKDRVEDASDGAIALTRFDDRKDAVAAIEQRDAFGAIVLGSSPTDAPEVLQATAASSQIAQMMTGIAQQLQQQIDAQITATVEKQVNATLSGQAPPPAAGETPQPFEVPEVTVTTTDVVSLSDDDPNGTGLTASMFPLVIGGMLGGIVISMVLKGSGLKRVVALVIYAAGAGLVLTGVLQGIYGALQGDYLLNAAAMALSIAAISSTITGLAGLLGAVGAGLGAAFTILLANPISGAMAPVAFIVQPWGVVGQWLPPGAAGTLIRNLSYFPDASTVFPWMLLAIWACVGAVFTVINLPGRRSPKLSELSQLGAGERASATAHAAV